MFLLALHVEVTPYYRESMTFTLASLNSRLDADAAIEAVAVISHLVFSTESQNRLLSCKELLEISQLLDI